MTNKLSRKRIVQCFKMKLNCTDNKHCTALVFIRVAMREIIDRECLNARHAILIRLYQIQVIRILINSSFQLKDLSSLISTRKTKAERAVAYSVW